MRRLPIYFLIDTSFSMGGPPIEEIRVGLKEMVLDLRRTPAAVETAHICVITFANEATVVTPLTQLETFQIPKISAGGNSSLGAGLNLLAQCIEKEVVYSTPEIRGDWNPFVILMTNGRSSDDWHAGLARFKQHEVDLCLAIAVGRHVRLDVLQLITADIVTSVDPWTLTSRMRILWED
jgi:uncharacterized protein YegL